MKETKMRGGIKRQGKDSWLISIYLGKDPETGKIRQKWYTVKGTKDAAGAKRRELLTQLDRGELVEPSKMTLENFLLEKWLPNHAKNRNLAPKTVAGYRERLKTHIIPALGHVRLGDLKPIIIDTYYKDALTNGRRDGKGGLSARTVKQHHAILHAALKAAVRWQMVTKNPCDNVERPTFDSPEMRIFEEPDDLWRFLDAVKADYPDYYPLFVMLLFTGVRRNEALGLTWGDLDFRTGYLTVKRTQRRRLKTKASERTIEVPETAMLVLREYREKREAMFTDMGIILADHDYVFSRLDKPGEDGRPSPLLSDSVTHAWIKAVRKAGFEGIRLHDARHTNISYVIAAGNDLSVASYLAGHSSIRVTNDVYTTILNSLKHKAAQSLNNMMARPPEEAKADDSRVF